MYNAEQKEKFIHIYTTKLSRRESCVLTFNALEEFEVQWGADFCTRTTEEILPVLEKITGLRVRSRWTRVTILKSYVKWCLDVGIEGAKADMLDIAHTHLGLEKVRTQTIPNPQVLQQYLDTICVPEHLQTTDNLLRCYYWLSYAGIPEDDIMTIRCRDVNIDKRLIRYQGNKIAPIYNEAVPALKNCVELDSFRYIHPNYTKDVWRPRTDGTSLIRGVRETTTISSIRSDLSHRAKAHQDETPFRLSTSRVWMSGVFYRTYQDKQNGIRPDFERLVLEQMEGKTYKLDSGRNTIDAKKRQLMRDYENDYEQWELVWY